MKNYYLEDYSSSVDKSILDSLETTQDVEFVKLKITATHAGRVNGNNAFYTPRSMQSGVNTLVKPFSKHLQKGHNGKAIGVITDAQYIDYTEKYPELTEISKKIEDATNPSELVSAVKELVNHPVYKEEGFEGLGVTEVHATLYDNEFIQELRTGENEGKVSIGGESKQILCSICASPMASNHRHKRGRIYDSEQCFAIFDSMILDHVGFVPNPADSDAKSEILDNKSSNDSAITIETYKIQDNLQGTKENMKITFEQLKELAANPTQLATVFNKSEDITSKLSTALDDIFKTSTNTSYLLSEDKLLPINSKLGVAAAKLAIESLEDTVEEKKVLQDLINTQLGIHFDGEDLAKFVTDLDTEYAEKAKEENTTFDTFASLPEDFIEKLAESVSQKLAESVGSKIAENVSGIEDSLKSNTYNILLNRNKTLEIEVKTIQDSLQSLTNDYREVIIGQILDKRQEDKESKYYTEVLVSQNVDQLKAVLSALTFTTEVKDSKEDIDPNLSKVNIQDDLNKNTQNDTKIEDQTNKEDPKIEDQNSDEYFKKRVKELGFAKALQEKKKKK